MWGLEKCVPIDQCRRMAFKSAHSDYLSPIAIGVLADENGVLKLFEPRPSDATIAMREKRMQYVRRYQAETTWLYETAIQKVDEALSGKKIVRLPSTLNQLALDLQRETTINSSSCLSCWLSA
ncbi:hypothetical protein EDD16DRAFT_1605446 [Pisolithus croceorrhizus]|nr:hypothetical protein EDD16DRAFT_1605446 [Pisolithus croceorrhizus]